MPWRVRSLQDGRKSRDLARMCTCVEANRAQQPDQYLLEHKQKAVLSSRIEDSSIWSRTPPVGREFCFASTSSTSVTERETEGQGGCTGEPV